MIRPFTAICVLLAGSSGLYLYTEKHRTTVLDQQISKIVQDTQHIREHTAMVRAEWALLNQPDRLAALAGHFLPNLQPMAPGQFVQMASLAQHLPEIPAPAAISAPAAIAASAPAPRLAMAVVREQAIAPREIAAPRQAIAPQEVMARTLVTLEAPAERQIVRHNPPRHASSHDHTQTAAPQPLVSRPSALRPRTPVRLAFAHQAAPRTVQASRLAAYSGAQVLAAWHPAYASAGAVSGSSLGFARSTLPAPVPVQDNQ